MEPRYRIHSGDPEYSPVHWISKWIPIGISGENGFWQQISPQYFRRGNALRYAKQHHITLENN